MGIKRVVDVSFWTDEKIDKFSPEDKYFMLFLLSNPFTTQLGIYGMGIKQAAFYLGYSEDSVRVLFDRFENKYGIIYYSKETEEIAIKNFLRHSIIKGGTKVYFFLKSEINKVKNKELISRVFSHIKKYSDLNFTVRGLILEYEKTLEVQSDVNGKTEKPGEREAMENRVFACGLFENVTLTGKEICSLRETYGEDFARKCINYLSRYIKENKETKPEYAKKDHYLVINRWVVGAVKEEENREARKNAQKLEKDEKRLGNFDVNEAFEKALQRTYGSDNERDKK